MQRFTNPLLRRRFSTTLYHTPFRNTLLNSLSPLNPLRSSIVKIDSNKSFSIPLSIFKPSTNTSINTSIKPGFRNFTSMTPKNNVNSTFDAQSDFKKIEESEIKKLEKQIEDLESQLIKKIKKEFESDKDNKSTFNINESVRIICGITAIIFCVMYDHLAVALLLALFVFG